MIVGGVPMLFGGAAAGGDPYFASVGLLLHGEGTDGSVAIVDSSSSPKTVTVLGNAQIDTAVVKMGNGALLFDGTGDYLTVPHSASLVATGGITIEAWIRVANVTGNKCIVDKRGTTTLEIEYQFLLLGGKIYADVYYSGGLVSVMGATTLSINTWYHVAFVINGTSVTLYLSGNQDASSTGSGTPITATNIFRVGRGAAGVTSPWYWNGHIDDLRVTTIGTRYTANFTPPTEPFPDF